MMVPLALQSRPRLTPPRDEGGGRKGGRSGPGWWGGVCGRVRITLAAAMALLLPAVAQGANRSAEQIVVIVADDLRPDALGFSGETQIRTPHLDRLAARGAVFSRATCAYPICNVSRSEMFTGRTLVGAGRGAVKFEPGWTLWAEHLRRAGWHTVYSGKWHVAGTPRSVGFAATAGLYSAGGAAGQPLTLPVTPTGRAVTGYTGWTFKQADGTPELELGVGLTPETDAIITDRALAALRGHAGGRLFLQVNYTAPHDPLHWPPGADHAPPEMPLPQNFRPEHPFDTGNIGGRDERIVPAPRTAEEVRRERALYFRQVEHIDHQVGRIVQALMDSGRLESTLIVFTSDHGLALGSHGLMGKQNQYEHTINVPLVLAGPGVPEGRRFPAQCYLRDLYPTVCELAGVEIPASVQGRSLVPVLQDRRAEVHAAIFGYFTDTQRMIRTPDGWKLIWYPQIHRYQLFHVATDPHELHDRADDPAQHERKAALQQALRAWLAEHGDALATRK